MRGKDLVFHTTVKEVREKELPAIDDEFAAKVLPGKTLEELKAAVKENIAQRKTLQIDEAKADQITEKLADMLDFNLPEAVVEREVYGILQQKLQQAMYSGNPPADMDKFVEDAREEARNEARRNLKVFFMLQEVAQVEKISVTEMELYNEVARRPRPAEKGAQGLYPGNPAGRPRARHQNEPADSQGSGLPDERSQSNRRRAITLLCTRNLTRGSWSECPTPPFCIRQKGN